MHNQLKCHSTGALFLENNSELMMTNWILAILVLLLIFSFSLVLSCGAEWTVETCFVDDVDDQTAPKSPNFANRVNQFSAFRWTNKLFCARTSRLCDFGKWPETNSTDAFYCANGNFQINFFGLGYNSFCALIWSCCVAICVPFIRNEHVVSYIFHFNIV